MFSEGCILSLMLLLTVIDWIMKKLVYGILDINLELNLKDLEIFDIQYV